MFLLLLLPAPHLLFIFLLNLVFVCLLPPPEVISATNTELSTTVTAVFPVPAGGRHSANVYGVNNL